MPLTALILLGILAPLNVFPPAHSATMDSFALLCNVYMECGEVTKPPMVIFADTGRALGLYYYDTDTVFVTEECLNRMADEAYCMSILLHEMSHYVSYNLTQMTGCETESVAWAITNAFVLKQGREDLLVKDWRVSYPQCRGYGDADYSEKVPTARPRY